MNRDQSVIGIMAPSVARSHPDYNALSLLDVIVTGGSLASPSSRLFQLREESGLFYAIGGSLTYGSYQAQVTLLILLIGLSIAGYFGYRLINGRYMRSNKIERTLAIIKPDAVRSHHTGKIIDRIEQMGFTIIDLRKVHLGTEQAEKFYAVHKDKKFFPALVDYMTGSPIVALVLEKVNAIGDWRDLMGATDPNKAAEGSIRKQFGTSIEQNAVHGSDAVSTAAQEIKFFFADRIN
ncbi:unnamed protein product [Sphagnum tenellum]